MKKTIIVNLFGGPGTGKSTLCGGLYTQLKVMGIDCEMAREYVKDLVWEESFKKIQNQQYIFGKQNNILVRLTGKVDVVITDSPLLLSIVYYKGKNPYFADNVLWEFNNLNTLNYYLDRTFNYVENGRMQTAEQAKQVDETCLNLLNDKNISYKRISPGLESLTDIINDIIIKMNDDKSDI
jgi:nicotinamide riboside kinase